MTSGTSPSPDEDLDRRVRHEGAAVRLEHHFLQRPWGRQHVVAAGPEGAPAILLAHGWPQHWFAWRDVIGALAVSFRVLAVDQRGFGWSDAGSWDGDIGALGDDLVAVLDAFGIPSAVLAAHDWGGWIGFRAVIDHPERFRRYSALSIMPPWLLRWAMARRIVHLGYIVPMALAGERIAQRPGAVRWLIDKSTYEHVWDDDRGRTAMSSYLDRIGRADSATMSQQLYTRLVSHELPAAWGPRPGRLAVPTTMLLGDYEAIARPELYWDRTHPGELRLVTVAGAKHWLAEEHPQAVTAHLLGELVLRSGLEGDVEPGRERP